MPPCRLPFQAYKMLLHLHEQNKRTWASSVCYVLYTYDFGDVQGVQGVGDEKAFLKEFKERVLSLYRQEWVNSIRTKERFTVYSTFKSSLSLAPYLNEYFTSPSSFKLALLLATTSKVLLLRLTIYYESVYHRKCLNKSHSSLPYVHVYVCF